MHELPASRPAPSRWRQALIDTFLTVLLIGGILLWFPFIRTEGAWAQLGGPSFFGLAVALALVPALLVNHLSFRFFDAAIERSGELAAERGGGPDAATELLVQMRPFRSRRVRQATTFLVFFNLLASSSALALWHRHSTAHASERIAVQCQVTRLKKGSGKDQRWRVTFECPLPGAAPATAQALLPEWQWVASMPPPPSLRAELQRGGLGGWLVPLKTVELQAAPRQQRN
ncbi:hypothetical protein ACN28I_44405 [Archangium gephyra]|uniref:hypothetical protein n=1 Tax=Archangium gephyra TaxID=48 RepID=UPI003B7C7610